MRTDEGPAGPNRAGWRFHVPVGLGIAGGVLLIVAVLLLGRAGAIAYGLVDIGLVAGGALVGLTALSLDEIYRNAPERLHLERQRDAERVRQQEERRLDFEQYRALQAELRDVRAHAGQLQAKLDLTGALDRDRVGDALLLGFYFHRRDDRLASGSGRPIFKTAAQRLRVVTDPARDLDLDKTATRAVLNAAYGAVVAEAFDLGYLLSHFGEDGLPPAARPEILSELERHLQSLRPDAGVRSRNGVPRDVSGVLQRVAARIVAIVRGGS